MPFKGKLESVPKLTASSLELLSDVIIFLYVNNIFHLFSQQGLSPNSLSVFLLLCDSLCVGLQVSFHFMQDTLLLEPVGFMVYSLLLGEVFCLLPSLA